MKFLKVIFLASVLHVSAISTMMLDKLPQDMMSNVIVQLVNYIGSPQLKKQNQADIPVIVKYVKSISCASKSMCDIINGLYCSTIFLNALTDRFGIAQINLIPRIKTPGTSLWLKNYLEASKEYEQFKTMKCILQAAEQVCNNSELFDRKTTESQVSHECCYQTKQGFFLTIDRCTMFLHTPWGEVNMLSHHPNYGEKINEDSFFKAFIERCDMSDVEQKEGQKSNFYFRLDAFDQTKLPIPQSLSKKDYRSREVIHLIWEMLQNQNDEENGIVKNKQVSQEQTNPQCIEMPAQEKHKNDITSPHVAVKKCMKIFNNLNDQPILTENGYMLKKRKVLTLGFLDGSIFELIWNNAMDNVPKGEKFKVIFEGKSYEPQFYNKSECTEISISRPSYNNDLDNQNLREEEISRNKELEMACENIITDLVTGWQQTTLMEYEDILHKESEEEWSLFIKKLPYSRPLTNRRKASCLKLIILTKAMDLFAKVTDLEKAIFCGALECSCMAYLWIKKSSFKDVVQKLNLKLMLISESMF